MQVRATIHDDRYVETVTFDAAPYLAASDDEVIRKLAQIGWGGNDPADRVAYWMEDRDPNVARVLGYTHGGTATSEPNGFEVDIDPGDALAWLSVYRPRLAEEVDA
jgi:hypothetical protein